MNLVNFSKDSALFKACFHMERVAYFLSNDNVLKNIRHRNACVNCNSTIAVEYITKCAGNFPIGLGSKFRCEKFVICEGCVAALPSKEAKNWLCPRCADSTTLNHEDIWGSEVVFPTIVDGTVKSELTFLLTCISSMLQMISNIQKMFEGSMGEISKSESKMH